MDEFVTRQLRAADAAASVAHDFIWGKNGVTKQQASDAIWAIHNALRPLLPLSEQPGYAEFVEFAKKEALVIGTHETCSHGCQREATVEHADGRLLCHPCYMVETAADETLAQMMREQDPYCPTCRVTS